MKLAWRVARMRNNKYRFCEKAKGTDSNILTYGEIEMYKMLGNLAAAERPAAYQH
jgi:hypothetical protein